MRWRRWWWTGDGVVDGDGDGDGDGGGGGGCGGDGDGDGDDDDDGNGCMPTIITMKVWGGAARDSFTDMV